MKKKKNLPLQKRKGFAEDDEYLRDLKGRKENFRANEFGKTMWGHSETKGHKKRRGKIG